MCIWYGSFFSVLFLLIHLPVSAVKKETRVEAGPKKKQSPFHRINSSIIRPSQYAVHAVVNLALK